MKKAAVISGVVILMLALISNADPRGQLTLANSWGEALSEAKARNVPIMFMWPELG